jgi:ATP-binding cassette subfamily B protein
MSDFEFQEEDYKKRLDPGLWKRILAHARPYRRALAGLAIAGVIVAAVDALLPRVTGLVIDEAVQNGLGPRLWEYCLQYLALVTLMAAMVWFFIVMAGRAATGFAYDLRRAGFARLQELSFSYYDRRPVGWLLSRITSDCDRVSGIIPWFLLDLVWGTSLIVGVSIMMLRLHPGLALLVMATLPPLVIVSVIFQRKLLRSQREMRKTNSKITASFNEEMMGVRTTKALVREEANLGEFRVLSGEMYRHSMRNAMQAAIYLPIVITIGSVGVGLSLWRGGVDISAGALGAAIGALTGGNGAPMSLGTLVAFIQYAAFFYMPVQELSERFTQLQAAQAAAERIQGLLDTVPEIRDGAEAVDPGEETIGQIEFHNVSFQYKEGQTVLRDFDLQVHSGETIALVGPTGGGKSTIVSLMCRFYEPTAGEVRINGVDYRKRSLRWLQSQLGVVLQTPHLFSGSVKENIRYGRLDATDEEVLEAARLVNADGFIQELEKKYETDVGEGGNRLSTGQKQLVSLARAVLADPQIFVMDEATSSVDTETERLIQGAIETVLEGRISFVIAHRLSTIRSADRILVIEKGRIVEEGNHEELIRLRGHYYGLYTNQFAREGQERILEEASKTA